MKNLLLLACLLFQVCLIGQTNKFNKQSPTTTPDMANTKDMRCNTMPALEHRIQTDKEYRLFQNAAMSIESFTNQTFIPCDGTNTVVVPVAFHFSPGVVDCGDQACVLTEVQDQLDALNLAFGDNTGTANEAVCPMAYQDMDGNSVASTGTCISFCLAVPPGGTADGLAPPPITIGAFNGGFNAGGNGAPGWNGILNIFITQGNCLGVADGIPGQANGDGVTVCAEAFGGFDPSACGALDTNVDFGLGATLVHEVGHYLGLFHTHVDGAFDCSIDNDVNAPGPFMVNDTPIQPDPTFGCFTTCEDDPVCAGVTNEPTANFMAYSNDACMSMFTEDQAAVMNFWARELFDPAASVCGADQNPVALGACSISPLFGPADGSIIDLCLDNGNEFALMDMSLNGPTTYNWTFAVTSGDLVLGSTTDNTQNPSLVFTSGTSGTIDVTLEVCDANNVCTSLTQTYTFNLLTGDDCPDTCDFTLNLTDSFGDGWNGATVEIFENGASVGVFGTAFTTGSTDGPFTIAFMNGASIDVVQTNGGFAVEEGFTLVDPFGITVAELIGGNPVMQNFTASCVQATCDDGMQNGDEAGVDCGGSNCLPCPACMAGLDEIINENFDACVMPAGWTVTATDGGTADITFNGGPTDVPGGGAFSPDFSGCIAIINDDANNAIGVGCIVTPVIDLSTITSANLTFDWHNNDFAGQGDFVVEIFDGTAWVQVFIEEEDNFGTDQFIDLSTFTNADFQIRFCYDDEGGFAWGAGIDNVAVCGVSTPICPTAVMPTDISGGFCDGSETNISATASGFVTYTWTSSNPNVTFDDPAAASTSVQMLAPTPCQIETADISLVAVCDLDGVELFNGLVSTVMVYPAPPADLTTLVVANPDSCGDPLLVDPNCDAFVTLTPDAGNPTFPVSVGDSGTAAYTITYASPAGAPDCCPSPIVTGGEELIIGGAAATQNTDGDLESIGATGASMVWTSTSLNFGTVLCDSGSCGPGGGSVNYGVAPNSGSWLAWFGGIGAPETGTLETQVVISACAGGVAELSFAYENSSCGSAADFIELQVDGTVLWSDDADPATCDPMGVPSLITVDLSAFADGASHTILFTSISGDGAVGSNFTIDNITLETSACVIDMGEDLCVATITGDYDCQAPVIEEIPTMGEWGLIILGIMFLIVSVVAIREQKQVFEKA
jgi:hypothetical protein